MVNFAIDLLVLGLATGTVSVTVAQSRIFQGVRQWIYSWSGWCGKLVSCPYCLGHWVSAGLVLVWWYETMLDYPRFMLVAWLAVTGISALVSGAIARLHVD